MEITETTPAGLRTRAGTGLALTTFACALGAAILVLVLTNTAASERPEVLTADVLGFALPVGLGLFQLSRHPDDRFARALVASGLLWSVTTLSQSSNEALYSVGRIAVWVFELALIYLMLAFPYGRLTTKVERRVVGAASVVLVALCLPAVFFAQFPTPSPWSTCGTSCPHNAFAVVSSHSAVVGNFVTPLRLTATLLLFALTAAVLVARMQGAGRLMRRTLAPVAAIAVVRAVAAAVYVSTRGSHEPSALVHTLGSVYILLLPGITLCFAAGLLSQRLFFAAALERLARGLTPRASAPELRAALARALGDPDLEIVYSVRGGPEQWVDENGWPAQAPVGSARRTVTDVVTDGRKVAAIVHDVELSRDPELVRAAATYALTALENERLVSELQTSLRELSASRARLVAVADNERRKIERDLHDGAQQRLVALRVKLELGAERIEGESPLGAATMRGLEDDVEAAIEDMRRFARGISPPLLADSGLGEALRAAARSAPLPATVDVDGIGRYAPEVEATVYFACLEALQNAAKHADGATGVSVSLNQNGGLNFEVRDDGAGFDATEATYGAGLTNLRDRLEAVGGTLDVESAPGRGTRIRGAIPTC